MKFILLLLSYFSILLFNSVQAQHSSKKPSASIDTNNGKLTPNVLVELINKADSLQKIVNQKDSLLNKANVKPPIVTTDLSTELRTDSFKLSVYVLIFGGILILSILFFLYKLQKGLGNFAFQTVGLMIVITAALFLIVTGFDKDQITPVIGLLGTTVGFIFGSNLPVKNSEGSDKK
jgi:hypothetical protein